jgi:hypothetical protein
MIVGAVNWASKQGHQAVGLILVQIRLSDPDEVRGIEAGRGGSAGCRIDVQMHHIVADATYECIPAIEPMNNINDAGGDLTSEVRTLWSQAVVHNEAQEGL